MMNAILAAVGLLCAALAARKVLEARRILKLAKSYLDMADRRYKEASEREESALNSLRAARAVISEFQE